MSKYREARPYILSIKSRTIRKKVDAVARRIFGEDKISLGDIVEFNTVCYARYPLQTLSIGPPAICRGVVMDIEVQEIAPPGITWLGLRLYKKRSWAHTLGGRLKKGYGWYVESSCAHLVRRGKS
jgi:hypothetical protein